MKRKVSLLLYVICIMSVLLTGCTPKGSNENSSANNKQNAEATETDQKDDSKTAALIEDAKKQLDEQLGVQPETGKGEKIGVLISSTSNEFWASMKEQYEKAGKDLGIDVQVFEAKSEDDAAGQLDALNTMVDMDFDAIILSPINGTNLIPGIVEANKKGIPVINLGPGVDEEALQGAGGKIDGRITVKFETQGEMVANDMVSRFTKDKNEVAILAGLDGAAQSEGRKDGALKYFESKDNVEVVQVKSCDWKPEIAYEEAKNILTAHPDIQGIFACNDNMALAAIRALEEMGKKDVLVYGVDFIEDAKTSMKDKKLMGTMTYSQALYTEAAEKMALILAQDKELKAPVYLPLALVTQDNVNDFDDWK